MANTTVQNTQSGTVGSGPQAASSDRVASVDGMRGLVILLMIFVNDAAGILKAPGWLKHASGDADMMTVPDVVFPWFLFVAGISIPLAFNRALQRGQTRIQILRKVLVRTLSLLIMGVVMVNADMLSGGERWGLCAYVALLFAFAVIPGKPGRAHTVLSVGRGLGIVALIVAVFVYRRSDGTMLVLGPLFDSSDTVWLRHEWWGILGLIGWAYLLVSIVYLCIGGRREWLFGATGLLMMHFVATKEGLLSRFATREWLTWLRPLSDPADAWVGWAGSHVDLGGALGSLAGITMAGCCLGTILLDTSDVRGHAARIRWAFMFGLGLALAAFVFDPLYGLNKIQATPSWCLLCAALATVLWIILYWLMDVRGHLAWAWLVRPAGENPLLAYLLHPLVLMLAGVVNIPLTFYKNSDYHAVVSILGSIIMAFFVVGLTGLIARCGFRIKV
jgi:predicted acyltransferase